MEIKDNLWKKFEIYIYIYKNIYLVTTNHGLKTQKSSSFLHAAQKALLDLLDVCAYSC